jgi:hypothetical protein
MVVFVGEQKQIAPWPAGASVKTGFTDLGKSLALELGGSAMGNH